MQESETSNNCNPGAVAEPVCFDRRAALRSTCDNEEYLQQIVSIFFADFPVRFRALTSTLESCDRKSAEREAHTIKGAAALIGAFKLRNVACEAEKAAHVFDTRKLAALLPLLQAAFAELQQTIATGIKK